MEQKAKHQQRNNKITTKIQIQIMEKEMERYKRLLELYQIQVLLRNSNSTSLPRFSISTFPGTLRIVFDGSPY